MDESLGDDQILQNYVLNINSKSLVVRSIPAETQDDLLKVVYHWHRDGWPKTLPRDMQSSIMQKYFAKRMQIYIDNQCLFLGQRLIIPPAFTKEILESVHKQHLGLAKAKVTPQQYYWWPNMEKELEALINGCDSCAVNQKGKSHKYYEQVELR